MSERNMGAMTDRYRLIRRLGAQRWHLEGSHGRALCGVAMVGGLAETVTRTTSDLRELSCPDCLAILTGKRP